jgi:hypothetical protein
LPYEVLRHNLVHDVKVLPNGHILLFNNFASENINARLEEVDPVNMKVVWQYPKRTKDNFKSLGRGSVQFLDGSRVLYTSEDHGHSFVNLAQRDGDKLWTVDLGPYFSSPVQGIYEKNEVINFLKNHNPSKGQ